MTSIIVPIAICVVLPVVIVWLTSRTKINSTNKRTEVLIEAIRHSGEGFDPDTITSMLATPVRSPREILNLRLLRGSIFSLIGLAMFLIIPFTGFGKNPNVNIYFYLVAGMSMAIGIGYLITYMVSRKNVNDEK